MIKNKGFKMAGVASVAIWPEERRNRKVAKLIQASVDWMNNHDFDISYLHPFHVPFYRKYGWELICSNKIYIFNKEDLHFLHNQSREMVRKPINEALS